MLTLAFELRFSGLLADEFLLGIRSISIKPMFADIASLTNRYASSASLWRSDGPGIKIRSRMHDIAERFEIGVLDFSRLPSFEDSEAIELPIDFCGSNRVFKLVHRDDAVVAESGIAIQAHTGSEIVLVSGAYPYTLSIHATGIDGYAQPAFDLSHYERRPLSAY